ncbi:hypothetical protein GOODEAATRI_012211 [Goodea atripinnis]|uniref:Uncharacterized protein n=1 Tax=Goodea atripinnis TaxID=208336 RepID=A0ABV0N2V3_9TELE
MAEVTSVTNRRAAGIRTTKCLFLLFTLLSLVYFTKAALNKKQLIELKQMYQKTKEKYQRMKSEHMSRMHTSSDKIMDYKKMIDMLTPLVRKYEEQYPDSIPLMQFLEKTRDFFDKGKDFFGQREREMNVKIKGLEDSMRQIEKIINFHEQQQAEL